MNVRELTQDKLYELKSKVYYMSEKDFQEVAELWDDNVQIEWEKAQFPCDISDETIYKLYDGIYFTNDDFFCTK